MFERYTERGRRVVFFARYEASVFGADAIEPEHIFLGVLREDKQTIRRMLQDTNIERDHIIEAIRKGVGPELKFPTTVDLPLSKPSKKVLMYAQEESDRRQHRYIGAKHILLGVFRDRKSTPCKILRDLGGNIDAMVEAIDETFRQDQQSMLDDVQKKRSVRTILDDETIETMRAIARSREQSTVQPMDLLLTLAGEDRWLFAFFSGRLVPEANVSKLLADHYTNSYENRSRDQLSEGIEEVITHTLEVVAELESDRIENVHLLIGLLRTDDPDVAKLLAEWGIEEQRVLDTLRQARG